MQQRLLRLLRLLLLLLLWVWRSLWSCSLAWAPLPPHSKSDMLHGTIVTSDLGGVQRGSGGDEHGE